VFGGALDIELAEMHRLARWLFAAGFTAECILVETRAQLAFVQACFPYARCLWYPNSRPVSDAPGEERRPRKAHRFVFIGQVKPSKGLREIIAASCELSEQEVEIDVFGPLQDGMKLEEFKSCGRVNYRGVLDPDEVATTLRTYDVVLLPTHHYGEGYPGIILEAYAAGIPVISTRWRAIPEIIEDGVSGLLVEPRSATELAGAMRKLMSSENLVSRLSEGARAKSKEFDACLLADRFVAICRAAANGDWREFS